MIIFGREIAQRTVGLIIGGLFLFILISFGLYQCDKRRDQAAQSRVERSQSEAASESAKDAIGTVTAAGERETASENLTRENERDIREAEGAKDRVNMDVHTAGLRSLCRRAAYKDSPRCAPFRKDAR